MPDVYVGLGSNVDPAAHLVRAVAALERLFGPVAASDVYRSPALGGTGDDYLNMVVSFVTELDVEALRKRFSDIEAAEGRNRNEPSRCALDLDLLLYGRRVDAAADLPRAEILRCAFVLVPLLELAPALTHPVTGEALDATWGRLAASLPAITRLGPLSAAARA